jgi:hypothetical protein
MVSVSPQAPRLLDQVRTVARLKHLSIHTENPYLHYIRQFILFHNKRHPKDMGVPEIRAFLSHMAIEGNVAASTQNVARCALVFLYQQVLHLEGTSINKKLNEELRDEPPIMGNSHQMFLWERPDKQGIWKSAATSRETRAGS